MAARRRRTVATLSLFLRAVLVRREMALANEGSLNQRWRRLQSGVDIAIEPQI